MNRQFVPNAISALPNDRPLEGSSNPRFYDFDDGVIRLVKWSPSPFGKKACYNELVASRLGCLLGAPLLRGLPVYLDQSIIPKSHAALGATGGFHFGVAYMRGTDFHPIQLDAISNSSALPYAAVHLAWLNIADHEGHNQFLRYVTRQEMGVDRTTNELMLIDMGLMFGDGDWKCETLKDGHATYKFPKFLRQNLTWASLEKPIERLKSLEQDEINSCFTMIPSSWSISDDEIEAAIATVHSARTRIEGIIKNGNPELPEIPKIPLPSTSVSPWRSTVPIIIPQTADPCEPTIPTGSSGS